MTNNVMTFEQLMATRATPSAEQYTCITEHTEVKAEREQCMVYGDYPANPYLIEKRADGFYPHAWWYEPRRHDTLEAAEQVIYKWYSEFA